MLVAVASIDQNALGRDQWQETDHHELMTEPITKWFWQAQSTEAIAETTRRGLKFASTPPCGPVFLSLTNQHARTARQGANMGAQQIRCADAHSPRQGGCRESGAHADRGQEPAAEHRRRDHLVPRRQGTARAGRTAWRAGRRRSADRSAIGRSHSRRAIRSSSALCCARCAFRASPMCCSISAIAGASSHLPAPN